MAKNVLAVAAIVYLAAFGLLAVARPERVRDFYHRQYSRGLGDLKRWPGLARWAEYRPKASLFRLFGLFSLCSSALLAYAWLRGY